MTAAKKIGATHLTLRLPADLKQQLAKDAHESFKSLNAEIVGRLRSSYPVATQQPQGVSA